ncbi:hypothetical protein [Halomonas sp. BC04]|uniref:hypothetical protein n=1 Tax=Halomonas sp. BC04 TaxID=1403540 RepID=UPI0003ED80D1|nr:hypothetical protein [Halomonas sp. BC04]EWG97795.1 hypothetical protein Q427_34040 [Halomonas sp. BC04]
MHPAGIRVAFQNLASLAPAANTNRDILADLEQMTGMPLVAAKSGSVPAAALFAALKKQARAQ